MRVSVRVSIIILLIIFIVFRNCIPLLLSIPGCGEYVVNKTKPGFIAAFFSLVTTIG